MNSTHTSLSSKALLATLAISCVGVLFFAVPHISKASEVTDTTTTNTKVRKAKVDATCTQTAVDTRETAVSTAWDTFTADIKTALGVRKISLHDAWGLTDLKTQKTTIAKTWKDWKKASVDAHKALKNARKSAWDAFKKTAKETCKITVPKEEALGTDASGSIGL